MQINFVERVEFFLLRWIWIVLLHELDLHMKIQLLDMFLLLKNFIKTNINKHMKESNNFTRLALSSLFYF